MREPRSSSPERNEGKESQGGINYSLEIYENLRLGKENALTSKFVDTTWEIQAGAKKGPLSVA